MKSYTIPIPARYRLRKLAGLSLRDLSDRVGVSKSKLSSWELGEARLLTSELRAVVSELNATSRRVLGELERILKVKDAKNRRRATLRPRRRPFDNLGKRKEQNG